MYIVFIFQKSDFSDVQEQNEILMMLLREYCEQKQIKHSHNLSKANGKNEVNNQKFSKFFLVIIFICHTVYFAIKEKKEKKVVCCNLILFQKGLEYSVLVQSKFQLKKFLNKLLQ